MHAIACNTRTLTAPLTGVQRYVRELLAASAPGAIDRLAPQAPSQGVRGHLWEQAVLPGLLAGRVLWSPSNSGPLTVRRQVVTVHDLVPIEHPEWVGGLFGGWYRFLLPKLLTMVEQIIAISNFTRDAVIAHYPACADRVSVIYNGVDARFSPRGSQEIEEAIRACGIPSRHYVLSLCSLEPRKNLRRLLEAWQAASAGIPDDVWLVLAGAPGSTRIFPELQLSRVPERIHFTGRIPDRYLPALLSGARSFVYPSLYEGFGLPVLEAMACGTPVITSSVTGTAEVVGDAGLLVAPTDVDALASALSTLIGSSELRATLARRGAERARQFSWQTAAQQTLSVLEQVARR